MLMPPMPVSMTGFADLHSKAMHGGELQDLEMLLAIRGEVLQGWVSAPKSIPPMMKKNSALGRFVPYARFILGFREFS